MISKISPSTYKDEQYATSNYTTSRNKTLQNKEILITGGTGSLGKTLTKLLIKDNHQPHGIRILSRDELKHWQMKQEINDFQTKHKSNINVSYIVGDIRNYESLYRAFENVDIVINTAAMKQIPTCEINPLEAVMTNVGGVENVIKAALARNVKRVMQVSTDKAVYPINLYGATKTVAEKLIIQANVYSGRKGIMFSCCRYGNVLGSRGSIIPLFKQQIADNKSITITHEDMTRFWITLPRVGRFLLNRLKAMEGGEIFIPYMKACTMKAMKDYIVPKPDYPVNYIGVRKGEKLHECLIAEEETWRRGEHGYTVSLRYSDMGIGAYYSNGYQKTKVGELTELEFRDMLKEVL